MSITRSRSSAGFQTFDDGEWVTIFDSTLDGHARIIEVFAAGDAVETRVTAIPAVHHHGPASAPTSHDIDRIPVDQSQPYAADNILKIEARRVSASSTVRWTTVKG